MNLVQFLQSGNLEMAAQLVTLLPWLTVPVVLGLIWVGMNSLTKTNNVRRLR